MQRPIKPTPPSLDTLLCPHCVHVMDYNANIKVCPSCEKEIPDRYVRHYKEAKPIYLQVFGWTASGKSVYLQVLVLLLMRMQRLWPSFIFDPANVDARRLFESVNKFGVVLNMPKPNQTGELHPPYIMLMRRLPRWGGRSLVLRDVAGEDCTDLEANINVMPYLRHAPSTLMFISLGELQRFREQGQTMDFLMDNYLYTLEKQDIDFKKSRRQIIIVLSKADLLFGDVLSQELSDYLAKDKIWTVASGSSDNTPPPMGNDILEDYINNMDNASSRIKKWLLNRYSYEASGLINRADENNITLKFSLVSALGANPITSSDEGRGGTLLEGLNPLRVLDPLFFALDFQSRPKD